MGGQPGCAEGEMIGDADALYIYIYLKLWRGGKGCRRLQYEICADCF